jgi:threonine/homoserine/homoserine lactone efflux protein
MREAIGASLPFAVGIALSPIPIVAVVLMLATPGGRTNGLAFVAGWVIGLAIVGTIVLVASSGANAGEGGEPASWVGALELVLGVLLLLVGARHWSKRPRGDEERTLPAWMKTIDTFTGGRSLAMGVALSGVNPKNLLLAVGAGAAIAQTGIEPGQQAVALAVFIVIATLGPALPLIIYFAMGDRSREILTGLRRWMALHNSAIMTVLIGVIGVKLVGDGIAAV